MMEPVSLSVAILSMAASVWAVLVGIKANKKASRALSLTYDADDRDRARYEKERTSVSVVIRTHGGSPPDLKVRAEVINNAVHPIGIEEARFLDASGNELLKFGLRDPIQPGGTHIDVTRSLSGFRGVARVVIRTKQGEELEVKPTLPSNPDYDLSAPAS